MNVTPCGVHAEAKGAICAFLVHESGWNDLPHVTICGKVRAANRRSIAAIQTLYPFTTSCTARQRPHVHHILRRSVAVAASTLVKIRVVQTRCLTLTGKTHHVYRPLPARSARNHTALSTPHCTRTARPRAPHVVQLRTAMQSSSRRSTAQRSST